MATMGVPSHFKLKSLKLRSQGRKVTLNPRESQSHHCRATADTSPWTPCLLRGLCCKSQNALSWSGKDVLHQSWPNPSVHSPQRLKLYLFASSFPQTMFYLSLNRFTPSNSAVYPPTSFTHIRDLSKFQQESKPETANKAQHSQRKAGWFNNYL